MKSNLQSEQEIDGKRLGKNDITALADDVPKIAENIGVSEELVKVVKKHLFLTKHLVQLKPNQEIKAFFTPINEIADLWLKAIDGTLSTAEEPKFKRLLAHEYIEHGLMEAGFPYHSRHEKAWSKDETGEFWPQPTKEHYGAHALAPHQDADRRPFYLWQKIFDLPADGLTLSDDLSNLDELLQEILRRVE